MVSIRYGIKRMADGTGTGKSSCNEKDKGETLTDEEKFLECVTVCRSCKTILL